MSSLNVHDWDTSIVRSKIINFALENGITSTAFRNLVFNPKAGFPTELILGFIETLRRGEIKLLENLFRAVNLYDGPLG